MNDIESFSTTVKFWQKNIHICMSILGKHASSVDGTRIKFEIVDIDKERLDLDRICEGTVERRRQRELADPEMESPEQMLFDLARALTSK